MKRNKKHTTEDLENFLNYSGNQMTGKERNRFEKDLQKDPFEAEAAEGFSSVSRNEALDDINELKTLLAERTRHSKFVILYRIAAAIAALFAIGTLILFLTSNMNRVFERGAVTENKRSDKGKNINVEEKTEPVILEKPSIETEVTTTNAPDITENKTVAGVKQQDSEITSKIAEDKKVQINEEIAGKMEPREDVYQVKIEEGLKTEAAIETIPLNKASKSETADAGRIITRKYVDNYVHGVVISSEDQLPLPGATVKIRGTTAGTYTDQNGNFELPIMPDTAIILVANYIGMQQNEVSLNKSDHVQIALSPSETSLDEVVEIGYGVQKKSNITGAISTIDMNESPEYQLPSPVIGNRKLKEYIKENLQYPSGDTTIARAVVVLNFIVAENGRPKNISVLKSPGKSFSEEAIRLLVSGPDWFPAKHNGKIIEEETMIRIVFKPEY
jgi:hypothetical protein